MKTRDESELGFGTPRPRRRSWLERWVSLVGGAAIVALAGFAGTGPRVFQPVLVAASPAHTAYVTNSGSNTVTPFNTATMAAGTAIPVGTNPVAVAITPDAETAYVVNAGDGTVTPITTATNTALTPITVGASPAAIAIAPDGSTAYVANSGGGTVTPIDVATNTPGTPITVGTNPVAIAITPDGHTAYVVNGYPSEVTPVNLDTKVAGTAFSIFINPTAIAITPDGGTAYVVHKYNHDVTAINTATNMIKAYITVGNNPQGVVISPAGTTAYVTNYNDATVTPINTGTNVPGSAFNVLGDPVGIAITPDGSTGYTTHAYLPPSSGWVSQFDPAANWSSNVDAFKVGAQPVAIAITPDQAPVAHLSVTPWPPGAPTAFDASASTVAYGSIASYAWDFGDGTQATTASPTTTHVYSATGTYTASVTETSSAGTSTTTRVFTGQTMTRNGGPQAHAQSTFTVGTAPVPTVTAISPTSGPAFGGTAVTLTGSGFMAATAVSFGSTPASSFTRTSNAQITAVAPVGSGTADVTVSTSSGTSATGTSDEFTWLAMPPDPIAFVANSGGNTVTPIDIVTNIAGAPIPVGLNPVAVAIAPDARTAYVTNRGGDTVTPIDTATYSAQAPIAVGSDPEGIAITPDGLTAYVANSGNNTVIPIDLTTRTTGTPIPVGWYPAAVAITPDGTTAYVANRADGITGGTVTPITLATQTALTAIPVGLAPVAIAITPDGKTAYVADNGGYDDLVTPIDIATNTALPNVKAARWPTDVAITPDGITAYVANEGFGTLTPITTATNTPGSQIGIGWGMVYGLAIAPDGHHVYVTTSDNTVWVDNIPASWHDATVPVGSGPRGIAITPDQAPQASLSVTVRPATFKTDFDASASTVAYGTVASYAWDFGDGTTATTTVPTTTHVYSATGTYTASVTETSSAGTSTTPVFTGRTMTRNGGPQARAETSITIVTAPVPTVTALSPTSGTALGGTTVTVTGSGFTYASAVRFGTTAAAKVTIDTDNQITAVSPAGSGTVDVTVSTPGGTSATGSADQFTYVPVPVPTVEGLSRDWGPMIGGTTLTITGSGFTHATAVRFGATPALSFSIVGDSQITATSPAGSGTVDVTVSTVAGTSSTSLADVFTYVPVQAAYVAGNSTVRPFDIATDIIGAPIGGVSYPQSLAVSPDGQTVYVADYQGSRIVPINTADSHVGTAIPIPGGASAIAITPDGTMAYVANGGPSTVTPVTLGSPPAVLTPVSVGFMPSWIAITPDGSTAYVANGGDTTVTPIDIATNTAKSPISVGWWPAGIAVTPDGSTAYVTNSSENTVTPIDIATNTAKTPITVGWAPLGVAITPDGSTAYVAISAENTVTPIDIATGTAKSPITVGSSPVGIAISPDGKTAYVTNQSDNTVTPIDIATNTTRTAFSVGSGPTGIAIVPDQAPMAKVTVTAAPAGQASSFDASASTVTFGTIAGYAWDFGDGTQATTTGPTTTHTYTAPGTYPASVTVTSSAGTSTAQVFTGQTLTRNGGPQAKAEATAVIAQPGTTTTVTPVVSTTVYGQAQQFTATVTAASGTPTGTVQFMVDGGDYGAPKTLDSAGTASLSLNGFEPSGHSVGAQYSGDSLYASSSADNSAWIVTKAKTANSLSSDTNPAALGTTVTFTATVTPVAPGAGTATGSVIFWDGTSTRLHIGSLQADGTATYSTSALTSGTHSISASYGGDSHFSSSYSTPVSQVVVGTATTTAVATSNADAVTGEPLTFTATVTPGSGSGTPTGTVQFSVDGTAVGDPQTMSGGQATISDVALTHADSPYAVTAVYSGDTTYGGSTGSYTQTVAAATTATTVSSATNPSVYGQGVTFTATVAAVAPGAGTPSGSVTIKDGTTTLGTCSLTTGSCTSSSSVLTVGPHSITAVYAGDTDFATSTSDVLTQTVGKAGTTTSVASDANPSVVGQSVTFTATVSAAAPGVGAATGTVTFKAGTTVLGTCDLATVPCAYSTASLALGSHSVTAEYGGDLSFTTSTSTVLTQTVGQASTSTNLGSSVNPSVFGRSVTFTATVSPVAPATVTPTGTVTFKDGAGTLGTCSLVSGSCTHSTTTLAVGSHSITAVFDGSSSWATSTSAAVDQVVDKASTTTGLTSSGTPSVFGQGVTFTATVSVAAPPLAGLMAPVPVGTPTGTVQFAIDGVDVGSPVTLDSNRQAVSTSITNLAVGGHSVTATYSGDSSFQGSSNSPAHTHRVDKASTATDLVSSLNPSEVGQGVTFTATVSAVAPGAGTPTGTVQFVVNGADVGSPVALSDGAAISAVVTDLTIGNHHVTARYAGDGSFAGSSTGAALTQTVGTASSATGLTSSVNPSVFGQSVTFTATVGAVTNGAGTPTGTVSFKSGADVLGSCTLAAGSCTYSTIWLGVGSHHITAVYGGDTTFSGSTSSAVTQTVNKASSATGLTSSVNPSAYGQSVTFTATVGPVAPSTVTPTGTVTFKDGTGTLGTCSLSSGTCTHSTRTLAVGSHSITAVYAGSDSSTTSTSTAVSQTVNKASTSTGLTSSVNPSVFGQGVTFTATVSVVAPGVTGLLAAVPVGTPTGSVQFAIGGTDVGSPVALDANHQATSPPISNLAVGSHSVTARYGGDGSFDGSTSSALSQTVGQASSATTLGSSANPSVLGQQVTLSATVGAVTPGAGTPTGTVTFKDGTTTLGTCALSVGSCTYSTTSLALGSHSITAEYPGDTNFKAGTSVAVVQQVTYQIKSTPPKLTTKLGSTLVFKVQLTNSSGTNISSPSLTLTVVGSTVGPVTGTFVYVQGRTASASYYQFSLKTTGLRVGSFVLNVSVSGDPAAYSVPFTITSSKR